MEGCVASLGYFKVEIMYCLLLIILISFGIVLDMLITCLIKVMLLFCVCPKLGYVGRLLVDTQGFGCLAIKCLMKHIR